MSLQRPARTGDGQRVIEALLVWEGAARNDRVRDLLGVHYTSASRQLAQYASSHEIGLTYSMAHRAWLTTSTFSPSGKPPALDEYLAITGAQGMTSSVLERTRLDLGNTSANLFATLHRACKEGLAVSALHASMRNPTPRSKRFFPHALVEAGRRWHVRAFVEQAGEFQDLALTRLQEVTLQEGVQRPTGSEPEADEAWNTYVDVRLVAHPHLTPEQKSLVRAEYFQRSMARTESVRGSLVPYLIQDLHVAIDPERQIPPEYQLCIDDTEPLGQWLMRDA